MTQKAKTRRGGKFLPQKQKSYIPGTVALTLLLGLGGFASLLPGGTWQPTGTRALIPSCTPCFPTWGASSPV